MREKILALGMAVCLAAGIAAGSVKQLGGDYVLDGTDYRAKVDGKTGLMTSLDLAGEPAVTGMEISFTEAKNPTVVVVQEGADQVVVRVSGDDGNGKALENAYTLRYVAEPDKFTVYVLGTVGRVCGRGPAFTLAPSAQAVRSLDFKELIALPALSARTPWTRVKFHYGNGHALGLVNAGAGNPFNANENGQIGGMRYARGGFVANSEYRYEFIPERGKVKTPAAPPMRVLEAKTPAVFWDDAPAVASLEFPRESLGRVAGLKGLRVKFRVEDAFEREVSAGAVPVDFSGDADPVAVKVPLDVPAFGWYRAFFTVNDAKDSLLEGSERLVFSRLKRHPLMGERFDNPIQTDYAIGLGLLRHSIHEKTGADLVKTAQRYAEQAGGTDVNVSYQIDGSPVGKNAGKFGAYVESLFKEAGAFVPRIEIINEPNGNYQPKEYIDTFLKPAYDAIKKVSPETKVIAPVLCGIAPDQQHYLEELYKLGLKDLTDELSFHPYAGNFDDGHGVASMRRLAAIIEANGDGGKPVHFTEAGYFHRGWNDVAALREIVKKAVAQYAWQNAALGIDHRHNFYYFTDQMGYYDMWLRATQLTPAAVALRQYTMTVKGQERARTLDFGMGGAVRAFRYPGKDKQVVLLWAAGNDIPAGDPDPAVAIQFNASATPERFDCFGNALPAPKAERRLLGLRKGAYALDVGTFPQYLVLPADATFEPLKEDWGANVALASLGTLAEASSEEGTAPAIGALDGNNAGGSAWRSAEANVLPQTLTVSLASPATVDRVAIWGYSPRGYDLEALLPDGTWRSLATVRDESYRRFRAIAFEPVQTDTVRLTIVDSHTPKVAIAEIELYSAGAKAGKGVELVNWALAENGATATASSELVKEATVAQQDWGAKAPTIKKIALEGRAAHAIDGKRQVSTWQDFFPTTWMADGAKPLPQWLEIKFDQPRTLHSLTVYTIAFARWTPETSGIRDWNVEIWDGKAWQVVDSVTGNTRVSKVSRFKTPVKTDRVRVVVKATNDAEGTVGIMEVEAFGPR